jgi:hypothetical protein
MRTHLTRPSAVRGSRLIGRNLLVPVRLQTMRLWWLGVRDGIRNWLVAAA